ncbi:MAG: SEL1-like repeat protein [Magnetococcales bacterium]|nr:SEL1-like repeat protein [Magnetococcales bacterium]
MDETRLPKWHAVLYRGEKVLFTLETLGSGLPEEQTAYRNLILVVTDISCIMVSLIGEEYLETRYDLDQIIGLDEIFPLHLKLKTRRDAIHIRLSEQYDAAFVKNDLLPAIRARIAETSRARIGFFIRKMRAKGAFHPARLMRIGLGMLFLVAVGMGWLSYVKSRTSPAPTVQVQPVVPSAAPSATDAKGKKGASASPSAVPGATDGNPVGKMMGSVVGTVASTVMKNMDPSTMGKLMRGMSGQMAAAPGQGSPADLGQMLGSLPTQSGPIDPSQFGAVNPGPGGADLDKIASSMGSQSAQGADLQKMAGLLDPARASSPQAQHQAAMPSPSQVRTQPLAAMATPPGASPSGSLTPQSSPQSAMPGEMNSLPGNQMSQGRQTGKQGDQQSSPTRSDSAQADKEGTPHEPTPQQSAEARPQPGTRRSATLSAQKETPHDPTPRQGAEAKPQPGTQRPVTPRTQPARKQEVAELSVVPLDEYRRQYPGLYDHLTDQELATGLYRRYYGSMPRSAYFRQLGLDPKNPGGYFTSLRDYRAGYPGAYDDMTDAQLASSLWQKFYTERPQEDFFAQIGLEDPQDLFVARELASELQVARELLAEGETQRAFRLFLRLSQRGSVAAQAGVGFLLANGVGTLADKGRAVHWYRQAARQGNVVAQYNLGLLLAEKDSPEYDDQEALLWTQMAAENGDQDALANLERLLAR